MARWAQNAIGAVALIVSLGTMLPRNASGQAPPSTLPETVRFPGPDGVTLVGYLFVPVGSREHRPAIVMMHGRAGPYSTRARGTYDASTLSQRHLLWGRTWSEKGYLALLVDGFGPRGFPGGFPAHSYDERPEAVNEVVVRPRDAYAALAYLAEVRTSMRAASG